MKVMRKSPMIRTHHTYHGARRTDGSGNVTAGGATGVVGCINYPLILNCGKTVLTNHPLL
jgi:hypothetical protein